MRSIELKNLKEELGAQWHLYSELRLRVQDKKKEILDLQKKFTLGQVNHINYQVKSCILDLEKSLLVDLFSEEFDRLDKLRKQA